MKREHMIVIGVVAATVLCLLVVVSLRISANQAKHERQQRVVERYREAQSRLERSVQLVNRKMGIPGTYPTPDGSTGITGYETWDIERDLAFYGYVIGFKRNWMGVPEFDLVRMTEIRREPIAEIKIVWTGTPDDEKIVIEVGDALRSSEAARLLRKQLEDQGVPIAVRDADAPSAKRIPK